MLGVTACQRRRRLKKAEPEKDKVDWDRYLGPAAWRPYNKLLLDGFNFEKGGGLVGGGCLEWGSHCVDLCQWANDADDTAPVEYELCTRATDETGRTQPLEPEWNVGGYGNNEVQRVRVVVSERPAE